MNWYGCGRQVGGRGRWLRWPLGLPALGIALVGLVGGWLGCEGRDDVSKILRERSQHRVELVTWIIREGRLFATLRVHRPWRAAMGTLTVEVIRFDDEGRKIGSDWVTLDLSDRVAGVPVEKVVVLPADPLPHALAVDMHSHPSEDVLPKLKELEGVPR